MIATVGSLLITDNPFHQKKSFIQDLEQYFEKEYKKFKKMKELRL
jgi:hypothetical protein